MWDVHTEARLSSFQKHTKRISSIRIATDGRLFLSSHDGKASTVTVDSGFHDVSSINLEGHAHLVHDILPLPSSSQCVTCSDDKTIKVWDWPSGACLRTLTQHSGAVSVVVVHPSADAFASGSRDHTVILWSSESFEVLHRIWFTFWPRSLAFSSNGMLYAGVDYSGVMVCNASTGEVGPVFIRCEGAITDLTLGMRQDIGFDRCFLINEHTTTVPARGPWTPSTHALWSLPEQNSVHMAVVVLWKLRTQGRLMRMPYELVEIVLEHVM